MKKYCSFCFFFNSLVCHSTIPLMYLEESQCLQNNLSESKDVRTLVFSLKKVLIIMLAHVRWDPVSCIIYRSLQISDFMTHSLNSVSLASSYALNSKRKAFSLRGTLYYVLKTPFLGYKVSPHPIMIKFKSSQNP